MSEPQDLSKKSPEDLAKEVAATINKQRAAAATSIGEAGAKANAQAEAGRKDVNASTSNGPASVTTPPAPNISDSDVVNAAKAAGITPELLAGAVNEVLDRRKTEAIARHLPKEPDYKNISEKDIYSEAVYIPVIEHEVPDYMNVELQDKEYVAVWANRDQRRLGVLLATGYELLRPEHIAKGFKLPLKFDSEGNYVYQDVVCVRVHKRIRFARLKQIQQRSEAQLRPQQAQKNAKAKLMEEVILGDPGLDAAFGTGKFGFYDTTTK